METENSRNHEGNKKMEGAYHINTVLPVEANLDDFTMTETPESGWFYSRTLPISEWSRGHLYSQNGGRGFTMTETPDRADFKTEHFRSLHFFITFMIWYAPSIFLLPSWKKQ